MSPEKVLRRETGSYVMKIKEAIRSLGTVITARQRALACSNREAQGRLAPNHLQKNQVNNCPHICHYFHTCQQRMFETDSTRGRGIWWEYSIKKTIKKKKASFYQSSSYHPAFSNLDCLKNRESYDAPQDSLLLITTLLIGDIVIIILQMELNYKIKFSFFTLDTSLFLFTS